MAGDLGYLSPGGGGQADRHSSAASSVMSTDAAIRNELTFKRRLLHQTLKNSISRPSGMFALHIKTGYFHDIDTSGTDKYHA